ncbi:hypothetical protein ACHQM5_027110 [Ranunculus cassubicifolius]
MEAVLNDDIVTVILTRVDTKTLVRCKCVCKRWQNVISDPTFMEGFITRSKASPLTTAMICHQYNEEKRLGERLYEFDRNIDFNNSLLDISLGFIRSPTVIIASHNGILLCVHKPSKDVFIDRMDKILRNYIVCNPLTKQWLNLPKPAHEHSVQNTVFYTYIKEQQIEFEVVSFTYVTNFELNIEVYSSETKTWKLSKTSHDGELGRYANVRGLFNESVYFCGDQKVYVYDLTEKSLGTLELPVFLSFGYYIGVSSGLLHYGASYDKHLKVWVRHDGVGWSLVRSINHANLRNEFSSYGYFNVVGFHPLKPDLIVAIVSVLNRSMPVSDLYLLNTCTGKIEPLNVLNHSCLIDPLPYCLPAWIPCLQLSAAKR